MCGRVCLRLGSDIYIAQTDGKSCIGLRVWCCLIAVTLTVRGPDYPGKHRQYHGCRCSGLLLRQDISSHGTAFVRYNFAWRRYDKLSPHTDSRLNAKPIASWFGAWFRIHGLWTLDTFSPHTCSYVLKTIRHVKSWSMSSSCLYYNIHGIYGPFY